MKFDLMQEAFNNIKGAVTIVFPMGLPEYEPTNGILKDKNYECVVFWVYFSPWKKNS